MSKILITSDVHIHNYSNFNIRSEFPSFRLNQFIKLANWINKRVEEEGVDYIFIAGDLLVEPSPNTLVINITKQFLNIISKNVKSVYLIAGNHDMSTKEFVKGKMSFYNILTPLTEDNDKLHYVHNQIKDIDGVTFHFHDWVPNKDIENHSNEAMVLIAHDDITGFTDTHGRVYEGSPTYDGYKLIVAGHIHKHQVINTKSGYAISPSSPIMHSYSDHDNTGVIILDTEELKKIDYTQKVIPSNLYKFIPTGDEFLKFRTATNEVEKLNLEKKVEENNELLAIRVKPTLTHDYKVSVSETSTELDIVKDAKELIPTEFLDPSKEIINNTLDKSYNIVDSIPNLNFSIDKVKIENFLSIRKLELNLKDLTGYTAIFGKNGSGKSTLIQFIMYMLTYAVEKGKGKDGIISKDKDFFTGELELTYNDIPYKIVKTRGSVGNTVQFFINGVQFQGNAMKDIEEEIFKHLSFIEYSNLWYITQKSSGIFSDMSDANRVGFISKFINLPIISTWTDDLKSEVSKISEEVSKFNLEVEICNRMIESDKTKLAELEKELENSGIATYDNHLEVLDHMIIKLREIDKKRELLNVYSMDKTSLDQLVSKQTQLNSAISISPELYDSTLGTYESQLALKSKYAQFKSLNEKLAFNKESLLKSQTELTQLSSSISENPEDLYNELLKKREEASTFLSGYSVTRSKLNTEIEYLTNELNTYKNQPEVCPTCGQPWNHCNDESKVNGLEELIQTKKTEIDTINDKERRGMDYMNNLNTQLAEQNKLVVDYQVKKARITELNTNIDSINQQINNIGIEISQLGEVVNFTDEFFTELEIKYNNLKELKSISDSINQIKTRIASYGLTEEMNKDYFDENLKLLNEKEKERESVIRLMNIEKQIDELNKSKLETETKLKDYLSKIEQVNNILSQVNWYISKVLTEKGLLVANLLKKVAAKLNTNNNLLVETIKEFKNGNVAPTLNIKLFVDEYNDYIDYNELSGAQVLLADIYFLDGLLQLVGGLGFMYLDELFKFFDTENIIYAGELLKELPVKQLFLVIHGSQLAVADNHIEVSLTKEGSQYSIMKG